MSTTEVILIVCVFVVLGFSLYKKYIKKDQDESGYGQKRTKGSLFSFPSEDDDYEPYSKR